MPTYSRNDISLYPSHIFLPRGMISLEEVMMLYDMARTKYSGQGEIVNAGAFIGASAYALAAGMCENSTISSGKNIHSYDLFIAGDISVVDFLQNNIYQRRNRYGQSICDIIEVDIGFDYSEVYEFQTQKYSKHLKTYSGDIKSYKWSAGPIEILFIDVCKTLEINSHIFSNFFTSLIPGVSIIIQQDFHHVYHPYIHVTLQAIKEYIKPISTKVGASRAYKYVKEVPEDLLEKVVNYQFDIDEKIKLFNELIDESPYNEKPLLHVAFVNELNKSGEIDLLNNEIKKMLVTYDSNNKKAFWYSELKNVIPEESWGQTRGFLGRIIKK